MPEEISVAERSDENSLENALKGAFNSPTPDPVKVPDPTPTPQENKVQNIDPQSDVKTNVQDSTPKNDAPSNDQKQTPPVVTQDPSDPKDPDQIKQPVGLTAKNQQGWKELNQAAKQSFRAFIHEKEQRKKAEKALADRPSVNVKEFEELKKENESLRGLRAKVDVKNDPDYIKDYSKPMEDAHAGLVSILKKNNVSDEQIKSIDFGDTKQVSVVYDVLKEQIDLVTANAFMRRAEEFLKSRDKNEEFLENHQKNYKEFEFDRKKQNEIRSTQEKAVQDQEFKRLIEMKVDGTENAAFPMFIKKTPSAKAPPDEVKHVNAHNELVDQLNTKVQNILAAKTPQERVQVAVAAASTTYLHGVINMLQNHIKAIEGNLKKIDNAGDVKPNLGDAPKPKGSMSDNVDVDSALASAFPSKF